MIKLERCYAAYFKNNPNDKVYDNEYFWQDKPVLIWVDKEKNVEKAAIEQLMAVAKLPFVFKHVAAMADTHVGYGITIGGVVACKDTIVPYFVGKDIGCGMRYINTNMKASGLTREMIIDIRRLIKKEVPMGMGKAHDKMQIWDGFDEYLDKSHALPKWHTHGKWRLFKRSLGSLGGGNHFMEIQEADDDSVSLMIHSGSRNLGSTVCDYHYKIAKEMCEKYHSKIPNPECSFFPTDSIEGENYITDMDFALDYAKENRIRMMHAFKEAFAEITKEIYLFGDELDVHHNYAALENHMGSNVWVHRKGAIRARKDDIGIIPGSQGTHSYIVKGLGNPVSFMSAPHGAGRKMGRNEACKTLNLEEETRRMADVVFDSFGVNTIRKQEYPDLQEASGAYKDIGDVITNSSDLVEVITELSPLGGLKGKDRRVKSGR